MPYGKGKENIINACSNFNNANYYANVNAEYLKMISRYFPSQKQIRGMYQQMEMEV